MNNNFIPNFINKGFLGNERTDYNIYICNIIYFNMCFIIFFNTMVIGKNIKIKKGC